MYNFFVTNGSEFNVKTALENEVHKDIWHM